MERYESKKSCGYKRDCYYISIYRVKSVANSSRFKCVHPSNTQELFVRKGPRLSMLKNGSENIIICVLHSTLLTMSTLPTPNRSGLQYSKCGKIKALYSFSITFIGTNRLIPS